MVKTTKQTGVLNTDLIHYVVSHFQLPKNSLHGPAHWMRVRKNGLELAEKTGANPVVIELFSLFHDSCRLNEHRDPKHGPRGAEFVQVCFDHGWFDCSHDELALLKTACFGHTRERNHADCTVATCWDADRLDLSRVGIIPLAERLCTHAAKAENIIKRARARADRWVHNDLEIAL